jgi:hypothetical protein
MTLKPESYGPILRQLIGAAVIATVTWALTTAQASAVQEQRLAAVEKALDAKASNEKVDALQREILSRLDRIENKVDRRK